MSGRLLLEGEDPDSVHRCDLPSAEWPGALWECDCGQIWHCITKGDVGMRRTFWEGVTERRARRIIKRAR